MLLQGFKLHWFTAVSMFNACAARWMKSLAKEAKKRRTICESTFSECNEMEDYLFTYRSQGFYYYRNNLHIKNHLTN